ncbi:dihydrodipicolinate synthase family protein [Streptomyces sp. CA-132043]|uniref:dihydrodipicolinate synthase family protein n=1 Tax=Streptomyces sp. CA-132043 TaxID=3240048 RepID=UPI003D9408CD
MPQSEPQPDRSARVDRLKKLRGTVVPLVTPVNERRQVCEESTVRLIESLRDGVTGFMPALSTGEGWRLSLKQWIDIVHLTVTHAAGAPVLAGVEIGRTAGILARAGLAAELGADAIVVPPPFPAADVPPVSLLEHFRVIVEKSPLPVFVYHENAISKAPLDVDALREVCALPGVVGVKESSGSAEFTRELLAKGTDVPVFQGWEHLIADAPGVHGFVGPLANLEPAACNAALDGFSREAQARVDVLSKEYELLADDWYLHVKTELVRRGVIGTALAAG